MHWSKSSLYAFAILGFWTFVTSLPLEENLEAKNPALVSEPIAPLIGEKHEFEISKTLPGEDVTLNVTKLIKTIENVGDVIPPNIVEKATQKTLIEESNSSRRKRDLEIPTTTAAAIDLDSPNWKQEGKVTNFQFPEALPPHSRKKRDQIETIHKSQTPSVGKILENEKEISSKNSASENEASEDHIRDTVSSRTKREDNQPLTKTKASLEGEVSKNIEDKMLQEAPSVGKILVNEKEISSKVSIPEIKASKDPNKDIVSSRTKREIKESLKKTKISHEGDAGPDIEDKRSLEVPLVAEEVSQQTYVSKIRLENSKLKSSSEKEKEDVSFNAHLSSEETSTRRIRREKSPEEAFLEASGLELDTSNTEQVTKKAEQIESLDTKPTLKILPSKIKCEAAEEKPSLKDPEPVAPAVQGETPKTLPSKSKRQVTKVLAFEEKSSSGSPDKKDLKSVAPIVQDETRKTVSSKVKREASKEKSLLKDSEVEEKSSNESSDKKDPKPVTPLVQDESHKTAPSKEKREAPKEKSPVKDSEAEEKSSSGSPDEKQVKPFAPLVQDKTHKTAPSKEKREAPKEKYLLRDAKDEEKPSSGTPNTKELKPVALLVQNENHKTAPSKEKPEATKDPEAEEKLSSGTADKTDHQPLAPLKLKENEKTVHLIAKREATKEKSLIMHPGIEENPSSRHPITKEPKPVAPPASLEPEGAQQVPVLRIKREKLTSNPKNLNEKQSTLSEKSPHSQKSEDKAPIETSSPVAEYILHQQSTADTLSAKTKEESQRPSQILSLASRNKREDTPMKANVPTEKNSNLSPNKPVCNVSSLRRKSEVKESDPEISVSGKMDPKTLSSNLDVHRSKREEKGFDLDIPVDKDYDMDLEEVNVFRPLFRYRAAFARQQPIG